MKYGKAITMAAVEPLVRKGAKLYDVRDPVRFNNGSIPGAENMQLRQVSKLLGIPKNTTLIFTAGPADDIILQSFLRYVSQYGFMTVYTLDAGLM